MLVSVEAQTPASHVRQSSVCLEHHSFWVGAVIRVVRPSSHLIHDLLHCPTTSPVIQSMMLAFRLSMLYSTFFLSPSIDLFSFLWSLSQCFVAASRECQGAMAVQGFLPARLPFFSYRKNNRNLRLPINIWSGLLSHVNLVFFAYWTPGECSL